METKKINRQGILTQAFALIFAIVFISLMASCGVRKTSTSDTKKLETNKQTEASIDTTKTVKANSSDENVKRDIKIESSGTEVKKIETVKPIDPTKPASFTDEKGNKKELNNATWESTETTSTKTGKKTDNTQLNKSTKGSETEQKGQSATNSNESLKAESENKRDTFRWSINWWWLLIPIAGILWYLYRRYKPKMPFVK
jgi:type IV secretory pathway VirB10-like protein